MFRTTFLPSRLQAGACLSGFSLFIASAGLAVAQPAAVLTVVAITGEVSSEHLGESRVLAAGDAIAEREMLKTAGDARLTLSFADEGILELGPDAALAIEKLPASAEASDLRSIVSLWKGYLRVQLPPPTKTASWPFYLYFGGQRSGLVPGEYFFERRGDSIRSCVASGRLSVTAIAGTGIETLQAGACYDMKPDEALSSKRRSAESWEAVRREFTIDPSGAFVAAQRLSSEPVAERRSESVAVPQSVAAARPVAVTAAVVAAVPAATSPAVAASDSGWILAIGSFADPQNAAQVEARLRAGGYTPVTFLKKFNGKTLHSVQLRGYATRELAETKAADVRARLGYASVRVVELR